MALRDARRRLKLTQEQVGKSVGRTQGWVNKIETAKIVGIRMKDLDKLFEILSIDAAHGDELRKWARSSYDGTGVWVDTTAGPTWWQAHEEVEPLARVIKAVQLQAHDGLIQSVPYMERQFQLAGTIDPEMGVRKRVERQRHVLDQASPPECVFILDEACLRKDMDDPAMMVKQLEHLLTLADSPHITILVIEFNARIQASSYGFTMLQFASAFMNDFVSIQYGVGAATIDDEDAVRRFQDRWEVLRSAALSEYDTRLLLSRVLNEYKTRIGQAHHDAQ